MGMDFNQIAMEYMKVFFECHPELMPEDEQEAFQKIHHIHGVFKNKLITKQTRKNEDFFSDHL